MFAVLMAFVAPVLHSFTNIIDSHISNNLFRNPYSIIFYNSITNILVIPVLLCFGMPESLTFATFMALLVIALTEVFYQLPYYMSLKKIDTSVTSALFSLGQITIPVMAFFLVGEKLHSSQYIGFIIVIFASILLNLEKGKRLRLNAAFYLMCAVSLMLSVQAVLYKYALENVSWVSALFYSTLFSSLMSTVFLLPRRSRRHIGRDWKLYRGNLKYFLTNEILYQAGEVPSIFALSLLPVVVIEGINATQPIFVLLFGFLLHRCCKRQFNEHLNTRNVIKKLICFLLMILGVILVVG